MQTYNFLLAKYKNLNSEEDFVNDYSYRNIQKLKSKISLTSKIKKPKFYEINKRVENFESLKMGSEKVLHEFQNLYIHKFLLNENEKQKETKNSFNTFEIKQKLRPNFKMFNDNKIKNKKEKEDTYKSLIKIIKNINIKDEKFRRSQSRSQSRIMKLYPRSSSKSFRKSIFNISERNKHLAYQYLKQGEKFLSNSIESAKNKPIRIFKEKSKLSLLKQISSKIINDKITQTLKLSEKKNKQSSFNLYNKTNQRIKSGFKLEESKSCFDIYNKNNNISSRNRRYIELSKNICNLSDAMVIHKKYFINSITKEIKAKKLPKKIRTKNINQLLHILDNIFLMNSKVFLIN